MLVIGEGDKSLTKQVLDKKALLPEGSVIPGASPADITNMSDVVLKVKTAKQWFETVGGKFIPGIGKPSDGRRDARFITRG